MTGHTFFSSVTNGRTDILQRILNLLEQYGSAYCVIDGLAVNAYAEPVVSLDLDLVIIADQLDIIYQAVQDAGMKVQEFEHSLNLSSGCSDLRIQLQKDPRYQDFLARTEHHQVLGYAMKVAALEDVLRGKVWAYLDITRRKSKRQKDLADIMRLVEIYPKLKEMLPHSIITQLDN